MLLPGVHPLCDVSGWLRNLLTLADGYRQDTDRSWLDLLRSRDLSALLIVSPHSGGWPGGADFPQQAGDRLHSRRSASSS